MTPDDIFETLQKNGRKSVHFIGIGGIGVSALARWFLAQNWSVSGSDLVNSDIVRELAHEGARIKIGQKNGLPKGVCLVIRSQAVRPENPEYADAIKKNIPLLTYPQMIGVLTRRYRTVAVAGAHGKSTSTAILSLAAMRGGFDPTIIVGTKMRELNGSNFRKGRGKWLVLEADEYGRAFLEYSPEILMVTNIDREHLDIYSGLADIKKTFMALFGNMRPGGTLILNKDDKNVLSLKAKAEALAKKRKLKVFWYTLSGSSGSEIRRVLKIPGVHNASNAAGTLLAAVKGLRIPRSIALKAIGSFRGSWRRYDFKGSYKFRGGTFQVFDDYAHHPTEIKTTLAAFREKFPSSAVICIFQPHQAERLRKLFPEFKNAFGDADALALLPEYKVVGREEKPSLYTSRALSAAVAKKHPLRPVIYIEDPKNISRQMISGLLAQTGKKSAVVVMMGAGTISEYTKKIVGIS